MANKNETMFVVLERNEDTWNILRTWVCKTHASALKCLRRQYSISKECNRITGIPAPSDCTDLGFFLWTGHTGMTLRYTIEEARIFTE